MANEAPVSQLTGEDGQLVDRLIAALDTGGSADDGWLYDAVPPVATAISAEDACPGRGPVDLFRIRERMIDVLEAGVAEDFLIRALRNAITEQFDRYASVGPHVNQRRATYRSDIEMALRDPVHFAEVRARYPDLLDLNDAQIRKQLKHLLTVLHPLDVDEAAHYWAMSNRWATLRESYLSDEDFRLWAKRRIEAS